MKIVDTRRTSFAGSLSQSKWNVHEVVDCTGTVTHVEIKKNNKIETYLFSLHSELLHKEFVHLARALFLAIAQKSLSQTICVRFRGLAKNGPRKGRRLPRGSREWRRVGAPREENPFSQKIRHLRQVNVRKCRSLYHSFILFASSPLGETLKED